MRIGISSFALRWAIGTEDFRPRKPLTTMEFVEKSVQLGAQAIQICENIPLVELGEGELRSLRQKAKSLDLSVELGMKGASPANLCRYLAIARKLGAGILRVVLADSSWKSSIQHQVEVFKEFIAELEAGGTTIAVENHFTFHPVELVELIGRVGSPRVAICLDPINSISKLVGPEETIRLLGALSVTGHAKDSKVTRMNTGFHLSGCPLGEGQVNIPEMIRALKQGVALRSIHVESWMDRLSDESSTLEQEEAWVRKGVQFLRRHM